MTIVKKHYMNSLTIELRMSFLYKVTVSHIIWVICWNCRMLWLHTIGYIQSTLDNSATFYQAMLKGAATFCTSELRVFDLGPHFKHSWMKWIKDKKLMGHHFHHHVLCIDELEGSAWLNGSSSDLNIFNTEMKALASSMYIACRLISKHCKLITYDLIGNVRTWWAWGTGTHEDTNGNETHCSNILADGINIG